MRVKRLAQNLGTGRQGSIVATVLALLALATGSGSALAAAGSPPPQAVPLRIAFGASTPDILHGEVLVAMRRGWDKEAGV